MKPILKLCILVLSLAVGSAYAVVVGNVANLSGTLMVKRASGEVKALAQSSLVEEGDLLSSQKDTYARIRFIDDSEVTLRPNTQFKIEGFSYDEAKPEKDKSVFSLLKGGLRSITGALGKRNHDSYKLKTPTATIGIRGTNFIAQYQEDKDAIMDAGLYVQVIEGSILIENDVGKVVVEVGKFGFVPTLTSPPVILPTNPGLKFSPPASSKNQGGWINKPDDDSCR